MITNVEGISSICCINRKFLVRLSCRRFYCIFMKIEGNTLNVTSQHREGYGTVKCLQTPVQLFTQQLQLHSCSSYTHPSLAVPPGTLPSSYSFLACSVKTVSSVPTPTDERRRGGSEHPQSHSSSSSSSSSSSPSLSYSSSDQCSISSLCSSSSSTELKSVSQASQPQCLFLA